jgi:hypothetical protein
MADDDDSCDVAELYDDPVAQRVASFGILALRLDRIQNPEILAAGISMLQTVQRSIKTERQGELTPIVGRPL